MNDLWQLVYVSAAVVPFDSTAIKELMARSVANNARTEITGILLYKYGHFLQAIEGTDHAVSTLFAKIAADPRHRKVTAVMKKQIAEREFKNWSMAFRDLNSPDVRDLPGFSDYLTTRLDPLEFESKPSWTQSLLRAFRSTMR